MVNTKPEQAEEESEEVREQKHKTFVEKYEKQIKHFGELGPGVGSRWVVRVREGWPSASGGAGAPHHHLLAGMLRRWDDSQKYLSDNVHLVCEETANYLVIWCIDLEVEEVCADSAEWGVGRAQKALPFFSHIFKILFIIHVCSENYSRHEGKKNVFLNTVWSLI